MGLVVNHDRDAAALSGGLLYAGEYTDTDYTQIADDYVRSPNRYVSS